MKKTQSYYSPDFKERKYVVIPILARISGYLRF